MPRNGGSKAQVISSSSQESRERESEPLREQTSENQTFTSTQKTPTHDRWSASAPVQNQYLSRTGQYSELRIACISINELEF